jgi:hypothetical protein
LKIEQCDIDLVDELNADSKEGEIDDDYYDENFLSLIEEIESETKPKEELYILDFENSQRQQTSK